MANTNGIAIAIPAPAPAAPIALLKKNIKLTKLKIMTWPAVILANNRINKVAGLINKLMISMIDKSGLTAVGTPGIHKICIQ